MHELMQDIRYSWRALQRAPGFSLTVGATLAIGIGATVTTDLVLGYAPGVGDLVDGHDFPPVHGPAVHPGKVPTHLLLGGRDEQLGTRGRAGALLGIGMAVSGDERERQERLPNAVAGIDGRGRASTGPGLGPAGGGAGATRRGRRSQP